MKIKDLNPSDHFFFEGRLYIKVLIDHMEGEFGFEVDSGYQVMEFDPEEEVLTFEKKE